HAGVRMPQVRAGRLRLEAVLEGLARRNRLLRNVGHTVHLPRSELSHAMPVDGRPLRQAVAQAHHDGVPFAGADRRTGQGIVHHDHAALLDGAVRPGLRRHRAHGEVVHDLSRRAICRGPTAGGRHHRDTCGSCGQLAEIPARETALHFWCPPSWGASQPKNWTQLSTLMDPPSVCPDVRSRSHAWPLSILPTVRRYIAYSSFRSHKNETA